VIVPTSNLFKLVMHGSSSVPEEEVRRINEAGGKLDPSARAVEEISGVR
jgi:fructose-bisphosphate aldolase, class II